MLTGSFSRDITGPSEYPQHMLFIEQLSVTFSDSDTEVTKGGK